MKEIVKPKLLIILAVFSCQSALCGYTDAAGLGMLGTGGHGNYDPNAAVIPACFINGT